MKILVVNDDGIESGDLIRMAEVARKLGEVWVVAPDRQCSAMSHRLLLGQKKEVTVRTDFPVSVSGAYSVSGTPAEPSARPSSTAPCSASAATSSP